MHLIWFKSIAINNTLIYYFLFITPFAIYLIAAQSTKTYIIYSDENDLVANLSFLTQLL